MLAKSVLRMPLRRVPERESSNRRVWANLDGSVTEVVYAQPVQVGDGAGGWRSVDLSLVADGNGAWVPVAGPLGVVLAGAPSGGVAVTSPVGRFVMRHEGATGSGGEVEGSMLRFGSGLGAGRDLRVEVTATGVKDSLVLSDVSGGGSYVVGISVPAGVVARQGSGRVEFVDTASGAVVSWYGSGVAWDSARGLEVFGLGGDVAVDVRLLDSVAGGLVRVGVSVAEGWLHAPDRVFPVTVDPSWHFTTDDSGGVDTYVRSDNPDGAYGGSAELHVGLVSSGVAERALVRWPVGVDANSYVLEAHVNMYNHWSVGCGARSVNLYAADSPFDDASTWNTQPDPLLRADGSLMGAISPAFAYGSGGCPPGWSPNMDATEVARAWVDGSIPNYGMLITASESDTAGRKFFLSREDGQWGSAPALSVTYTDRPPVSEAVSPAAGAVLVTSTPTLVSTSVTDPDGPVKYWFRVATDPSGEANVVANSGWVSSPSWQVPDRVLNDGQTYYWRVWTMDALGALRAPGWVRSLRVNMRLGRACTKVCVRAESEMVSGGSRCRKGPRYGCHA
jgi:hypothetical protein